MPGSCGKSGERPSGCADRHSQPAGQQYGGRVRRKRSDRAGYLQGSGQGGLSRRRSRRALRRRAPGRPDGGADQTDEASAHLVDRVPCAAVLSVHGAHGGSASARYFQGRGKLHGVHAGAAGAGAAHHVSERPLLYRRLPLPVPWQSQYGLADRRGQLRRVPLLPVGGLYDRLGAGARRYDAGGRLPHEPPVSRVRRHDPDPHHRGQVP